ncbi:DedA family protein, partial [Helicobacter pylori]
LISAMVWASITIILAWCLGEELLHALEWLKKHPYVLILLLVSFLALVLWYFQYYSKKNR